MPCKPHILFIAPFPPPVHGSAVVSLQIKESKAVNDVFDFDYVNISTSRKIGDIGRIRPVKFFRFFGSLFKVFGKLATNRYDLCYLAITCYGRGFLKDAPFALLCKLFGNRIVIHQHNKGMSNYADKPLFRFLYHRVYDNAKVILLSRRLYPDIEKVVKRENVLICPNGIKMTEVLRQDKSDGGTPRILFLSNLLISKGVLILLDALEILKKEGCQFVCDFVGSETGEISAGKFAVETEKRALAQNVFYHGQKKDREKEAFFNGSDIFVFPTFNECFGLVLLEAMEKGLPCITTDEGGIPDIVVDGETGVIVGRRDAVALSEAIRKLLENPELRIKMGQAGRRRFESLFTEEQFEKNFINCLK